MDITFYAFVNHLIFVAYKSMLTGYNAALDYFSTKDEDDDNSWFIPALIRLSNDLRIIANKVLNPTNIILADT